MQHARPDKNIHLPGSIFISIFGRIHVLGALAGVRRGRDVRAPLADSLITVFHIKR